MKTKIVIGNKTPKTSRFLVRPLSRCEIYDFQKNFEYVKVRRGFKSQAWIETARWRRIFDVGRSLVGLETHPTRFLALIAGG
jgi:hypothetical protein